MVASLKRRNFWIMLGGDATLLSLSYYFAYCLRFDADIPHDHLTNCIQTITWIVLLKLCFFFLFGLYKGMWRYTGIHDMINLVKACVISSAMIAAALGVATRFQGFARSVFVIDFVLTFLFVGGLRVAIRLACSRGDDRFSVPFWHNSKDGTRRLVIIGAGDAGEMLLREIRQKMNPQCHVIGFVDDDGSKYHQTIHGVPVLGSLKQLDKIVSERGIDEAIIAVPSAEASQMRRMVDACDKANVLCKTLPALHQLIDGRVTVNAVRNVLYEDLLGREPVRIEMDEIGGYLAGKRVMVTGGAGSIGSELCNQILRFEPEMLVILDRAESGLYETEVDLAAKFHKTGIIPILGGVQNRSLMQKVFHRHKPEVIFHAAAYKHVPMMELQPWEAVFNNIVGTQTLLSVCKGNGVDRCVIVSTDKAVRPTNVMGATKRVDEILAQIYARKYNDRFMAVRFGNVVGSAGSVLPLFRKQIEKGGPVTVTHPEVTRYFMTIPEASLLILQAGAMGQGGEIFILKMGTPVKIADMARDIIRLSGFEPDKDIQIKYTGLRPGEKLYEELMTEGENIDRTEHEAIMVLNGSNDMSLEKLEWHIQNLIHLSEAGDAAGIRAELKRIVPEYTPWEDHQSQIDPTLSMSNKPAPA